MPIRFHVFAIALAVPLALGVALSARQAPADAALLAKAKAIHEKAITLDTHVDIGGADYATEKLDPGGPTSRKCDLPKMKAGGLDGVFLAAYVGQRPDLTATGFKPAYNQAIAGLEAINRLTKMHPELCDLGRSPADVERIAKTGKRAILVGVENGYPMGDDLANLKTFYDLRHALYDARARVAQPARRFVGPGRADAQRPVRTREEGRGRDEPAGDDGRPVARLREVVLGRHRDVEGADHRVALRLQGALTERPEPRRRPAEGADEERRRHPDRGAGVVPQGRAARADGGDPGAAHRAGHGRRGGGGGGRGAGGQGGQARGGTPPTPLTPEQQAELDKRRATYQERLKEIDAKYPFQPATLKDFVDHIDYAVKVAGIDHVGVGTDFDGGGGVPGFNDHSEAFNVTVELVKRGYTEQQITKIWGGNLLRVWREVEKAAMRK